MTNNARYLGLIIATFPELRERLAEEEGIHLKTHAFVDFVNAAIARADWTTVERSYTLMDRVLHDDPDDEVSNAVYVSFVEHLDFHSDSKNGAQAKKKLTPRLLQAWKELEQYWLSSKKSLKNQKAR